MEKARLPLGIDNFGELITNQDSEGRNFLFVDKSLLIKDIIDGAKITLITRPRRFGKTLNMSMLQHFFADKVGDQTTKGLFDELKVSKFPKVMEFQGNYPVIYITFKEIRGKNFEEAFEGLKIIFSDLYMLHKINVYNNLEIEDQKFYDKILNKEASLSEYESSLQVLTRLLYEKSQKQVIILLDEYDTPLLDAYCKDYYDDMRGLIATMFNKAFKGNNFLYKAVITGILKIVKSSLFSEFNNPSIYTILDSQKYANCFGFTEDETADLLQKAGLKKNVPGLKEMYNGYHVGEYTLYNPFSITNFIDYAINTKDFKESLKPYWVNSGGTQIITNIIKHSLVDLEKGLTTLINKEPISTLINQDIVMGSNLKMSEIPFWSLMLISGYLKVVDSYKNDFEDFEYSLLFTNEEIRKSIKNLLLYAVGERDIYTYSKAMQSLVKGELEIFTNFLKDYLKYTPSYFDTTDKYKEQFYHGLILGMTASVSTLYVVKSNRESGGDRYDIAIEPRDIKRNGIIIELKAANESDNLEDLATEALEQIQTKNYKNEMQQKGIKNIIPLGIAFKRNEVAVKY